LLRSSCNSEGDHNMRGFPFCIYCCNFSVTKNRTAIFKLNITFSELRFFQKKCLKYITFSWITFFSKKNVWSNFSFYIESFWSGLAHRISQAKLFLWKSFLNKTHGLALSHRDLWGFWHWPTVECSNIMSRLDVLI